MSPRIYRLLTRARRAQPHRTLASIARQAHAPAPRKPSPSLAETTLRGALAEGSDGDSVRRLATLSGSAPPQGPVLFAERNGNPVAAIAIVDGHLVSDPAHSTLGLLMRLRAERALVRAVAAMGGV